MAATVFVALTMVSVTAAEESDTETPAATGSSKIKGKVSGQDGAALSGVQVHAYHLATEQMFTSAPTGGNGAYTIEGLPHGYFDLAVETPDGLFVGNQVASLPPNGKAVLNFTLSPFTDPSEEGREFPGADGVSSGVAQVRKKDSGREFWRSPKGVATIAGGGGLVLLAVASGGGGSDSQVTVSPDTP